MKKEDLKISKDEELLIEKFDQCKQIQTDLVIRSREIEKEIGGLLQPNVLGALYDSEAEKRPENNK